jgi:hypothetical protein
MLQVLVHTFVEQFIGQTPCLRPRRTLPAPAPRGHAENLIELFEQPIPEGFKEGREVLRSILGAMIDNPILDFAANQHLTVLTKPEVTPVVWDTKERLGVRARSDLEPMETPGQELLFDCLGCFVTLWCIHVYTFIVLVYTCSYFCK